MTLSKVISAQEGFLHHKVAPQPQIRPELAKTMLNQNHSQNITFRSVRGFDRCYFCKQPLYFQEVILSKITRVQEEYHKSQSGSFPYHKNGRAGDAVARGASKRAAAGKAS